MSSPVPIKVDDEMHQALVQLFLLAGLDIPTEEISSTDVLSAIREIRTKLETSSGSMPFLTEGFPSSDSSFTPSESADNPFANMASFLQSEGETSKTDLSKKNILIVGELGIVTYQLKLALSKIGPGVTIVKGIDEAITEYQKRPYSGVLIDIFMPTEREGMLVLAEIYRLSGQLGRRTEIVVLATPVKERHSDLKEMCLQKGATLFLEKTEGWHQRVLDFFSGNYTSNDY